jgi:hypothetical protein
MHPLGTYLAISDGQRDSHWDATDERRTRFARVDAAPLLEPETAPRRARLAAALRRLVLRERYRVGASRSRRVADHNAE